MSYFYRQRFFGALVIAVLATTTLPVCADELHRGLHKAPFSPERVGTLKDKKLLEVSGIATSRRRPGLLWVHNDSGSKPTVYAVTETGRSRGAVTLRGATARDWEDMASFDYHGTPMLVLADVGDNNATRATLWLHFIEEPEVPEAGLPADLTVDIAWSIPFRYPDGAADCESIAVDLASDRILLLTKRENPPTLYALPIKPDGARPGSGKLHEATRLGEVTTIPRPLATDLLADPVFGPWSSQPTAMDVADNELLILTYRDVYRFVRSLEQTWAQALRDAPTIVPLPKLKQSESIAFDRSGRDFFVTSERRNAPIYRMHRVELDTAEPEVQKSADD